MCGPRSINADGLGGERWRGVCTRCSSQAFLFSKESARRKPPLPQYEPPETKSNY